MTQRLCQFLILFVTATLCTANSAPQYPTQDSNAQTSQMRNHVTITGCLTKSPQDDFVLVDQRGIHNLIYPSDKFDLDSYVGQSVTLIGDRSAIPSTDTGTARPMPHFKVAELRQASGKCGK